MARLIGRNPRCSGRRGAVSAGSMTAGPAATSSTGPHPEHSAWTHHGVRRRGCPHLLVAGTTLVALPRWSCLAPARGLRGLLVTTRHEHRLVLHRVPRSL